MHYAICEQIIVCYNSHWENKSIEMGQIAGKISNMGEKIVKLRQGQHIYHSM